MVVFLWKTHHTAATNCLTVLMVCRDHISQRVYPGILELGEAAITDRAKTL